MNEWHVHAVYFHFLQEGVPLRLPGQTLNLDQDTNTNTSQSGPRPQKPLTLWTPTSVGHKAAQKKSPTKFSHVLVQYWYSTVCTGVSTTTVYSVLCTLGIYLFEKLHCVRLISNVCSVDGGEVAL